MAIQAIVSPRCLPSRMLFNRLRNPISTIIHYLLPIYRVLPATRGAELESSRYAKGLLFQASIYLWNVNYWNFVDWTFPSLVWGLIPVLPHCNDLQREVEGGDKLLR